MIGFITTPETATLILDGIRVAQESRGHAYYWTTGAEPIYSGVNKGQMFIPASDELLNTPLRNGLTPRDFPEFAQLVDLLGGLEERVVIESDILIDPETPEELYE